MNKDLIKYDIPLYFAIFNHELQHSSGFSFKDIKLDLKNEDLKGMKKKYYKFILKHPKSWIEFLPFWIYEGNLIINPLILCFYGIILIVLGGLFFLL
jgi:hypothetical protein